MKVDRRKMMMTVGVLVAAGLGAAGYFIFAKGRVERRFLSGRETGKGIVEKKTDEFREKQLDAVIMIYRKLLEKKPDDAGLKARLGEALLALKKFDEAAVYLGEACRDPKVPASVCFKSALARSKTGDREGALRDVDRALVLDPHDAKALQLKEKLSTQ